MKKKILAALICAALALTMTACSEKEDPNDNSSKDKSSKSSVTEGVSTPSDSDNSSSETSSTADSKPEESKPEETSTPAGSGIDWGSVPYADELDFMTDNYKDGVRIIQYLGSESVLKIPETIDGKKVTGLTGELGYNLTDIYSKGCNRYRRLYI